MVQNLHLSRIKPDARDIEAEGQETRNPWMSSTWRVGRYRVTMAVMQKPEPGELMELCAEWDPKLPRKLGSLEWEAYRNGRDAFFLEVAAQIGANATIAEG